jgi:hypothetical protein
LKKGDTVMINGPGIGCPYCAEPRTGVIVAIASDGVTVEHE